MGLILSCAMCTDSSQYQNLTELSSIEVVPSKLKSPHQISSFAFDSGISADEGVWTSVVTPDGTPPDTVDLLRNEKIQQLLQCVGWEVFIDGLGFGRLVQCVSQSSTEIHYLAQLQDGRQYIVPVLIQHTPDQMAEMPQTRLIQRVISV